jgi:single-strand DNA-binding protein
MQNQKEQKMINNVVLVGRLTEQPQNKKTSTGKSVSSFTVAIPNQFDRDKTDFIKCVAWNQSADYVSQYGAKGDIVAVEGRISTRSYDGSDGKKVYVTEVVASHVSLPVGKRTDEPKFDNTPEPSADDLPF